MNFLKNHEKTRGASSGATAEAQLCPTECPAPTQNVPEISNSCVKTPLPPIPDPAPTTTCERGLESVARVKREAMNQVHSEWGRSGSRSLVLQSRDWEMMRVIYEQQFLVMEQVWSYFFKDRHRRKAYERIEELRKAGFLRLERISVLGGRQVIRLTSQGLKLVRADHPLDVPLVRRLDLRTLAHDEIVTSVRLRLSELWDGIWIPEKVIKQEDYPQVPDGLFVFSSGKKVAVEIENSPKTKTRFLANLERWRRADIKLVLFVTTQPGIFKHIGRCLEEGPRGVPFALVSWSDLKTKASSVWTPSGQVEIFERREY